MSILFKNCDILAGEGANLNIIKSGFLGVGGRLIDYIGKTRPEKIYDSEKDMDGAILMPALVNAHGHPAMTFLRGAGTGMNLQDWLNKAIFPVEAKITPKDVYVGTLAACLEMLAFGSVCFSSMYDFPFAEAEAVAKSGMKSNISRVGLCLGDSFDEAAKERLKESYEFIKILRGDLPINAECEKEIGEPSKELTEAVKNGLIIPEMCLHSEYLTKEDYVRAAADVSKELGAIVNVHVSETRAEHEECIERHGKTPIAYFLSCGLLDSPTYAAHCVWVSDEDFAIMAEKGVSLVHNPSSNLKLGSGIARISEAVKRGVNVAIGTDGAGSNNNLNMFEELHIASLLATGSTKDPLAVTPREMLTMATKNGASAMGRYDTGSLEEGKAADIAAVGRRGVHMHPDVDTLGLLCYSAQGSDVVMTMCDGEILYENGEYLGLDKEEIVEELEKTVAKLSKM